jgi:quinol monooxygenase YgiN
MLVLRFKVKAKPEKIDEALGLFGAVPPPSRELDGVIHFDAGRDLTDPNAIIFTEVFEDRAALDRQKSLPEVHRVMGAFDELLAGEPEVTLFHVAASEPWG